MAKINTDANKLVECGEDIISLCEKYNQQIELLFSKLEKIPQTCWTGDSANLYVSQVKRDKSQFIDFGNKIAAYGNVLKSAGNNINTTIEKWRNQ